VITAICGFGLAPAFQGVAHGREAERSKKKGAGEHGRGIATGFGTCLVVSEVGRCRWGAAHRRGLLIKSLRG